MAIALFNTGVDASGNVLSPGALDPHWTMTSSADVSFTVPGPAIVQANHTAWLSNDSVGGPGSSWISIDSSGTTSLAPGSYVVETTFDLTGLDPSTASIELFLSSDNSVGGVELNGNPTGITQGGFAGFGGPFTLDSGFVAGTNTLEIIWSNAGTGPNPAGIRVELSGTADPIAASSPIPEPSGGAVGIAIISLLALYRRR